MRKAWEVARVRRVRCRSLRDWGGVRVGRVGLAVGRRVSGGGEGVGWRVFGGGRGGEGGLQW